ncbi:MAG: hypothetical protein WBC91_05405 [Phototrophicaceae bacterium]
MLFVGGLTAIAAGVFCFTDADMAWYFYELDHQFWGQSVHKPTDWRAWVYSAGASLIILGLMALVAGIQFI